jgi:hypothetical protein
MVWSYACLFYLAGIVAPDDPPLPMVAAQTASHSLRSPFQDCRSAAFARDDVHARRKKTGATPSRSTHAAQISGSPLRYTSGTATPVAKPSEGNFYFNRVYREAAPASGADRGGLRFSETSTSRYSRSNSTANLAYPSSCCLGTAVT